MTDKAELRYALEERAAIQQYDAGLSKWLAQEAAAKARGFNSWQAAMEACNVR